MKMTGLRYDLTDTAGVLENKVLSMFQGLHDQSVLVQGPMQFLVQIGLKMGAGDCPSLNMNAMQNYLL